MGISLERSKNWVEILVRAMRLLQFALGFVLGCIAAGIAAVLLVPKWYYDYGRWIGVVEVGYKIPGALGNDVSLGCIPS
jgi:hypothetical protein